MNKSIRLSLCFGFVTLMIVSNVFAVIFADDIIYLFEEGKHIKDSSVLYKSSGASLSQLKVCENGMCFRRQKAGSLELVFYKTKEETVIARDDWWEIKPKQRPNETYDKYLEQLVEEALYSIEVTLPDETDKKTYNPPPEGMTGGTIGSARYFQIDIAKGEVGQRKASDSLSKEATFAQWAQLSSKEQEEYVADYIRANEVKVEPNPQRILAFLKSIYEDCGEACQQATMDEIMQSLDVSYTLK